MRVQDLMSCSPATCHVNDPLNLVAHEMWNRDCGALPVVNDDGKLAGMITDRDICMAAYTQGRSLDAILVNSAMAAPVIAIRPGATIADAERLMAEHQVRRLPVVDDDNKPIGVVSLTDLAIECDRSDTGMEQLATTLAAVCRPRTPKHRTA